MLLAKLFQLLPREILCFSHQLVLVLMQVKLLGLSQANFLQLFPLTWQQEGLFFLHLALLCNHLPLQVSLEAFN